MFDTDTYALHTIRHWAGVARDTQTDLGRQRRSLITRFNSAWSEERAEIERELETLHDREIRWRLAADLGETMVRYPEMFDITAAYAHLFSVHIDPLVRESRSALV